MSKRQSLMLIGVWMLLLAVAGFPPAWKTVLLILTGVGVIWFGYAMRPAGGSAPKKDLPFTDYKRPQNPESTQAPVVPSVTTAPPDESAEPLA